MADAVGMIAVEVAYASEDRQALIEVLVSPGATLRDVVEASGILESFPEIDLDKASVGIFSKPARLGDPVSEHDRVEIYRPLQMDPKEARRQRAKKGVRT